MLPSLIVLDNFLSNPAAARQQALSLPYPTDGSKGNYAGTASSKLLQIANISQAISRHLNYRSMAHMVLCTCIAD